MNRYTDSPCMRCTSRHATCHAECMAYLMWKADHDRIHNKIVAANNAMADYAKVRANRNPPSVRWLHGMGRNFPR